jgi:hypothetical protein
VRFFLLALVLLAIGGGGYVWFSKLGASENPLWLDLGSLLRLQPGRETLYQFEEASSCYPGSGSFLALSRLSAFNGQVRAGAIDTRLVLYLRNDGGDIVALVARDPQTKAALTVNLGRPGFATRDEAKRWDQNGTSLKPGVPGLVRLNSSVVGANLRLDARPVACASAKPAPTPAPTPAPVRP